MKINFRPLLIALTLLFSAQLSLAQSPMKWKIHDLNRPVPPVIDPGTASTPEMPGHPPSDAAVLFDGTDLSKWTGEKGKPAERNVSDGSMEVRPKNGANPTQQAFRNCHVQ